MKINCCKPKCITRQLFLILLVLLLLSCQHQNDHSVESIDLNHGFTSLSLNNRHQYYISENDKPIEQVAQLFSKGEQRAGKTKYNAYQWLFFTLNNQTAHEDIILEINNNYLHQYQLYQLQTDSVVLIASGGIAYPFHHRSIKNRRFIEKLHIPKSTACSYILKIDDRERETSLSLRLWEASAFHETEVRDLLFYNLYFGGLILIAFFSLFIGFILKMRVFYAYCFYALMMAWFMFDNLGFAYDLFYPNHPAVKRFLDTLLITPLLLSFVHFGAVYFNTKQKNPVLYPWIQLYYAAIGLYLLIWILSGAQWIMNAYLLINYTFVLLTFIIQIIIVVQGIRYQRTKAYFFMSAVFVLLIGSVLFALSYASHIPYEWFPTNPLLIGSVIEFGIFSVALIYEVRQINQTKNDLLLANAQHQKKLLAAFVEGTERERARLSAELHDSVGSRLALLKHKVNRGGMYSKEVNKDIDQLYKNVRSMSHDLSPHLFEIISLQEYLENYLADYQTNTGIIVEFHFEGVPKDLGTELNRQIFRIIQEALQNVLKHANAQILEVQLIKHSKELVLTIDDDGQGFDVQLILSNHSNGIHNMRSRLEALDGSFEISSLPGKGTHILASIPLKE